MSVNKIKEYHSNIADDLNTPYPFARNISTDGKAVWYDILGNLIKADKRKQFDFKQIIEPFLHKIDFGGSDIAKRFYPLENNRTIVIDPERQFGQPIINGTCIKAETIYNLFKGGEEKEFIAELYELNISQVDYSIRYFKNVA